MFWGLFMVYEVALSSYKHSYKLPNILWHQINSMESDQRRQCGTVVIKISFMKSTILKKKKKNFCRVIKLVRVFGRRESPPSNTVYSTFSIMDQCK